jgi:hypothetical protein
MLTQWVGWNLGHTSTEMTSQPRLRKASPTDCVPEKSSSSRGIFTDFLSAGM